MWSRKHSLRTLPLAALGALVFWACHVAGVETDYLDVKADSTWTEFDSVKVVVAKPDGTPIDTVFRGVLDSPDRLKKLKVEDYDGGRIRVILIGIDDDHVVKVETRHFDGQTGAATQPPTIVITPLPGDPDPNDSAVLDIRPDPIKLYTGGATGLLAPAGSGWAGKTLDWSVRDASIATVSGGKVTPVAAGKTWIVASFGSKAKDSSEVIVATDVPVIDAGPDTAVPLNASLALKAKVSQEYGSIAAFKWSLDGDSAWDDSAAGLPADRQSFDIPSRKFPEAGSYALRFYARDTEGNETVAQRQLTVSNQIPKITSLQKDYDLTEGDSASFTGEAEVNSGSLKKYAWNYGDGAAEAAGALSGAKAVIPGGHRFAKAGSFKVTLSVEDDAGTSVSASVSVTVKAKQSPKAPKADAGKDTSLLAGGTVRLRGTGSDSDGTIAKYEWGIGGGSLVAVSSGDTGFTAAAAGSLVCILRVTDNDGLWSQDTVVVTVTKPALKPPVADAGKDTSVQVNTAAKLHGSATDADGAIAKLEWSIAGGSFAATSGDTSVVPGATGLFRCVLRATDNDGQTDLDTVDITVTKAPPPVISAFTPAADTIISIGDSVSFTLKASGPAPLKSYSWDFNGDGTADETGALVGSSATLKTGKRYAAAGSNVVTFKVTDEEGEVQTRQVTVTVETDPPKAEAGKDTTVAAGTRVNLHGKASDKLGRIVTTQWKIGAAAFANAPPESGFVAPAVGGVSLNCLLRATDDDGLSDTDTVVVTVQPAKDANLQGLSSAQLTLTPAFAAATLAYADTVAETVASAAITATAASAAATVRINGGTAGAGSATATVALAIGINAITVQVIAQDTSVKKTYTLSVRRLDQTPPAAPTVTSVTPNTTGLPTWTWAGGGGGNGNFRYKLDNADLTTGATATTAKTYTPASPLADGTHTLYVQEADTAGNWSASGKFAVVVTAGPVSWYKFDGNYADAGLNANTGVASGSPAFVADRSGAASKAIGFNGTNAMITAGTAATGVGNKFSVALWVKITTATALQYFVRTEAGGIAIGSRDNAVTFAVSVPGTNSARATVTPGAWTHIVGTYDGAEIQIFKNGVLQATTAHPGTNSGNGSLTGLVMGYFNSNYWDGAMDDLRFYPRILGQAEITALANQ